MKTSKKLEQAFKKIEQINYDNEHGGAYAYLQFLAYTREVLHILRPIKYTERQTEAIEAMTWLFNEYLTMNFTHRHKALFEDKLSEIKLIFDSIRSAVDDLDKKIINPTSTRRPFDGKLYQQAA